VKPAAGVREHEHEFEAQPGLPEPLPPGEQLLWQGAPDVRELAIHAFHARKLALYFAALIGISAATAISNGGFDLASLRSTIVLTSLAVVALGIVLSLAWLSARTTLYTITDRRVVMRIGIVLGLSFNLPFTRIEAAGLRHLAGGHGDIPLTLKAPDRIAWLNLWPHARPWQVKCPQPMLRAIADVESVSRLLSLAWAEANGVTPTQPATPAPARLPRHARPTLAPHG
jgi:Bacterial PH domain